MVDSRETGAAPATRSTALAAVGTAAVGGVVAWWHLGVPAIWRDEAVTAIVSTRTWPKFFEVVTTQLDAVHAMYFVVMKAWLDVVGISPLTLRAPSVVAFSIAVALLVVLGARLGSVRLGVTAGVILVCLPRALWTAGEGRGYAATLMVSIMIVLTAVLATTASRRWWYAYGLALLVGAYLFLYLVLLVPAIALFLWGLRGSRRDWQGFLLATGGALLAAAPLVVVATSQTAQLYWVSAIGAETVPMVLTYQWVGHAAPWVSALWWAVVIAGLLVVKRNGFSRAASRGTVAMIIGWLAIPTVALVAVSAVTTPIYFYRYGVVSLAAMALAVAFAINALPRWWLRATALVTFAVLSVQPFVASRAPEAKGIQWTTGVLEWQPGGGGRRGPTDAEWAWMANTSLDLGVRAYLSEVSDDDAVVAIAGDGASTPYDGPVIVGTPSAAENAIEAVREDLDGQGRRANVWSGLLPVSLAPEVLTQANRVWVVLADPEDVVAAQFDENLNELGFTGAPVMSGSGGTLVLYTTS